MVGIVHLKKMSRQQVIGYSWLGIVPWRGHPVPVDELLETLGLEHQADHCSEQETLVHDLKQMPPTL